MEKADFRQNANPWTEPEKPVRFAQKGWARTALWVRLKGTEDHPGALLRLDKWLRFFEPLVSKECAPHFIYLDLLIRVLEQQF